MGITAAMFVTPCVASFGAAHILYAVILARLFRRQGSRYFFVAVGEGILIAWGLFLLSLASAEAIFATIVAWTRTGVYGSAVAAGAITIAMSPLIGVAAAYRIRKRPITTAMSKKDE